MILLSPKIDITYNNKTKQILDISLSKHQSVSEWVSLFVCSLTPPKRRTPATWILRDDIPLGMQNVLG